MGPSWLKMVQVGPKMGPRGLQGAPRWAKLVPRWPKLIPRWPDMAPPGPKDLQDFKMAPRWAQEGSKMAKR